MKKIIKDISIKFGIATLGITTANIISEEDRLNNWLSQNYHADMNWIKRNPLARCDPKSLLPEAKSVICTAFKYTDCGLENDSLFSDKKDFARFARGKEYHKYVKEKLHLIWKEISKEYPEEKAKICVDTSPILEKALAARAGLGWIGKNTLLINPKIGSYFVLGEIITTLEIEPDKPIEEKCGTCDKCITTCPTQAIRSPYIIDAKRCISYLTIESKEPAPEEFRGLIKEDQYGCDICQEVCPYNKTA